MKVPQQLKKYIDENTARVIDAAASSFGSMREIEAEARKYIPNITAIDIEKHIKTLHGMSFKDFCESRQNSTRLALKNRMIQMALAGDRVILIWLSKQWLGMSEPSASLELSGPNKQPIEWKETDERISAFVAKLNDLARQARDPETKSS